MTSTEAIALLEKLQAGLISRDAALRAFQAAPVADLGFAKIDTHRALRKGFPEVVYGEGKTPEQVAKISPIIDKTASQLSEIRGDTGRRVRDVIIESHREIAQYLTPEQQQRLKQMEEHRRHWMQQHHGPWRRGGGAEPASSPSISPAG